jgi:hypothetical protein
MEIARRHLHDVCLADLRYFPALTVTGPSFSAPVISGTHLL